MIRVILLAGGVGSRMKSTVPKQHIVIGNHQIIEYTLMAFSNCKKINSIMIVSNSSYIDLVKKLQSKYPLLNKVIVGGKTRIESVRNAIWELKDEDDSDKVIISDAARPFVTKSEIEELINSLDTHVAVTTGLNSNETILKIEKNDVIQIIQRDGIIRQTSPEGYRLSTLKHLYLMANREIISSYRNIGIDQLHAEGVKIGIVKSNPLNFKITTPDDLLLFEAVLKCDFKKIINK